jgi:hypothetical protein
MLRLIQSVRLARALMLATGVLVVIGSFGLHPEPGAGGAALSRVSAAAEGAAWSADAPKSTNSHDCPACLTHRPVSIARLAGVPLHTETRLASLAAPEVRRPTSQAARPYKDRAPPAVS